MSIDLSLDRLREFLPRLPREYRKPTIHIAGTNGKGSVSAILSSILLATSPKFSVGRYNSPHLTKITDCITIDDEPVDDGVYIATREEVEDLNDKHGANLSPFEVLTVTALQIFEKAQVDLVVLEVGMGGRLDATNIIPTETVLVSALTTVDLDHQGFLGSTIEAIATEKLGIARSGRPVVLGGQRYADVELLAHRLLAERGSPVKPSISVAKRPWNVAIDGPIPSFSLQPRQDGHFDLPVPQPIEFTLPSLGSGPIQAVFPLQGDHQLVNLATALGVIDVLLQSSFASRVTPDVVKTGLRNLRWRGRLSWHLFDLTVPSFSTSSSNNSVVHPVLADGAHNEGSSQALATYIQLLSSKLASPTLSNTEPAPIHLHYILAMSHSPTKPPSETLRPLFDSIVGMVEHVDVHFVRFTLPDGMPWVKPVTPTDLATELRRIAPAVHITAEASDVSLEGVNYALVDAFKSISRSLVSPPEQDHPVHHLVVVAGSLYLIADFYRLLEGQSAIHDDEGSKRRT